MTSMYTHTHTHTQHTHTHTYLKIEIVKCALKIFVCEFEHGCRKKMKQKKQEELKKLQQRQEKPVSYTAAKEQLRKERKAVLERGTFKIKAVYYSKKLLVRIDDKTHIYVDHGADVEKIRRQYLTRKYESLIFKKQKQTTVIPVNKGR